MTIRNFTDHAANERTFLAWLRTGLAVSAFGLVVDRLNLFLAGITAVMRPQTTGAMVDSAAPLRHYEGLALILLGIVIMVLGGIRFLRASREIDRAERVAAPGSRVELMLTCALALLTAGFFVSLALL